ncbi:hypothetical protein [Brevundimonas sp.]|uniref:hypothetical protein n=1 Tax=Brevundimonas sp. TaxID=1871086 RepID=UPI002D41F82D|nr:hypothetical protein [Brevundimonas sp.]HYD27015.1 hypothetical protein [Brevundimonas sp.]
MKRAMLSMVAAVLAGGVVACSPEPPQQDKASPEAAGDWTRPPVIQRVERAGSALVASGLAEPDARVVLRSDGGGAFAASADASGRFEIRLPAPAEHLLLRPETQVGQDTAPSPDRLLILAAGQGPIVVLRPGGPTRRLDAAPVLGAVDSDGRMRLASGRAPGLAQIEVRSGGETVQVDPDAQGRWSVMLAPHDGPDQIQVAGRDFNWPGEPGSPAGGLAVERIGSGWRVAWTGPGGARQATWLPDLGAP